MSRHLGDEIAVLDGLDGFHGMSPTGPGTGRSSPSRYVAPFSTVRRNVVDPSEGGNYGGGSNWALGMPVMPSAVGLADAELQSIASGVLPPKFNVIDPSGGALFTGGSSWTGGIPLTPSNAGLAGMQVGNETLQMTALELQQLLQKAGAPGISVDGVWGSGSEKAFMALARAHGEDVTLGELRGVVVPYANGKQVLVSKVLVQKVVRLISRTYGGELAGGPIPTGRADSYADFHGLSGGPIPTGRADSYSDFASLDAYFEAAGSSMTPTGPGTGRSSPSRYVAPFATVRRDVIDPSEGANYGGGSSWAPRMPLMPSTVGLAELSVADMLDAVSDNAFTRKLFQNQVGAFTRVAGKNKLQALKAQGVAAARRAVSAMSWPQRAAALRKAQAASIALSRARIVRRALLGNRVALPTSLRPMRTIAAA